MPKVGERDFTPEDIGQLRETMDAMAPIVAQSFWLRRRQPELGAPLDLFKSHLNELQARLEQSRDPACSRQTYGLANHNSTPLRSGPPPAPKHARPRLVTST